MCAPARTEMQPTTKTGSMMAKRAGPRTES